MGPSIDEIVKSFAYHPPKDELTAARHSEIREICAETAKQIYNLVPESPERTHAINKVREAMFWANAGIAVHS